MSAQIDSSELQLVRAPKPISAARFDEMLNILPPRDWYGTKGRQTFKMSEFLDGDITTIFCQLGDEHFELQDSYRLTHREIIAKCEALKAIA